MNIDNRSRSDLLDKINAVSFVVNELNLYLNTHPDDSDALEMFADFSRRRLLLLEEFAKRFGPLTVDFAGGNCDKSWNWIHFPWPWQEGGC